MTLIEKNKWICPICETKLDLTNFSKEDAEKEILKHIIMHIKQLNGILLNHEKRIKVLENYMCNGIKLNHR